MSGIEAVLKKREVREFLYIAEIESTDMGESEEELIGSFAKEIKKDPYISRTLKGVAKDIKDNKPKHIIYRPFMDRDIISLVREGEKNQIPITDIFKAYVPNKELGDKIEREIRRKLIIPIVIYLFAVLGLHGALLNYKIMIDDGIATLSPMLKFFVDNYYPTTAAFGFLAIFLFVIIPKKVPPMKAAFHRVEALLVLATIDTMKKMGYSAGKTRKSLVKIFRLKLKSKKYNDELEALMDLLVQKKYLNIVERAKLKIYAQNGKMMDGISDIVKTKQEEIVAQRELIDEVVAKIGMFLLAFPLMIVVSAMLAVLDGAG